MSSVMVMLVVLNGLTAKALAEGEKDPLWNRPSYQRKVIEIGNRLLERNHIAEHVQFVVDSENDINAYGDDEFGIVHINRGLLKIIENDDELAFILGHEIGHVLKRHGLKQGIATAVVSTSLGVLIGLAAESPEMAVQGVDRVSGGVNGMTSRLMNGRELEADAVGLELMVGAGYEPWASYRVASKMFSDGYLIRLLRTHPNGKTRLAKLEALINTKYPNHPRYPSPSQPLNTPDPNQPQAVPTYIQE